MVDNKPVKMKVLEFANRVSGKKIGKKGEILPEDPEYRILAPIMSEEMAEVALRLEMRKPKSSDDVAGEIDFMTKEEVNKHLQELARVGVCFWNVIDGKDMYWFETWVPGIMEMVVNNLELVRENPELAVAFDDYGKVRGQMTVGNFPVGAGLMRVIPIESALDGNSKTVTYEEISKYFYQHDKFSVSDCACRTVRESMGEGCGHLKEDMCIQMGHAAEYYIRTGRGREITREEAFEIIHRAEENGLMHQIPNLDGTGETHAICNCCGCSCLSLRSAGMFYNADMVRSNYVAKVDKSKCVACGECVENCPVNALRLGQKIESKTSYIDNLDRDETPRNTEWGPERWNPDYRTNRKNVVDSGTSPCKTACPAHIGIQGYIQLAAEGKYTEALELIKKNNPFPAICGRICPRSCETACTRAGLDEPIAIDDIKKFIAEQDLHEDHRFVPKKRHEYGNKIAVIGAGPAGLSCAFYLAIDGYDVTVFEKEHSPGGMLRFGLPAFRLEKDVIGAEIDIIEELGVKFKTGVEVGKDISLDQLRAEGYEAFYLGIGAQSARKLNIEGEEADGVIGGIDFLRKVNLGEDMNLTGKTIVIGGGNVAIDVARTSTRVGSETTNMFCLESREEMPALDEEIHEAEEENIIINNSWGPKRVLVENGKVVGVEFKKCLSVFDENRRFSPKFDEEDILVVEADNVLISVGQAIDWGNLLDGTDVKLNPNNTVIADSFTFQTDEKDIFVGGDAYTGPRFAIDAIAQGKEGAISIHRFVQPGQSLVNGRDRKVYVELNKDGVLFDGFDSMPRQRPTYETEIETKELFRDRRGTLTEAQMKEEADRCLGCGVTIVDEFMCVGCGQCTTKCKFGAISLERVYDKHNYAYEDLKPQIIKQALKRKVKIQAKKVKDAFVK